VPPGPPATNGTRGTLVRRSMPPGLPGTRRGDRFRPSRHPEMTALASLCSREVYGAGGGIILLCGAFRRRPAKALMEARDVYPGDSDGIPFWHVSAAELLAALLSTGAFRHARPSTATGGVGGAAGQTLSRRRRLGHCHAANEAHETNSDGKYSPTEAFERSPSVPFQSRPTIKAKRGETPTSA